MNEVPPTNQSQPLQGLNTQRLKSQDANPSHGDCSWPWWPLLPLYPYGQRRTLRQEVVPETVWTFEQLQGVLYVVTPIRMTVVRLAAGGLLVYAPVAPTRECLGLIQELVERYGPVKYILLPTVSGLEHKVFVGPFARRFAGAQVIVAPHQWSFPVNLPLSWLGLPLGRTRRLDMGKSDVGRRKSDLGRRNLELNIQNSSQFTVHSSQFTLSTARTSAWEVELAAEFEWAVLGPIGLGVGPFEEVALFHRQSRSLLVTDSLVSIPEEPPAITLLDPFPLLYHAKDSPRDRIVDTPANRRKGWQRIVLFSFYFQPGALRIQDFGPSLRAAQEAPERSRRHTWGWFPYEWRSDWQYSFDQLCGRGRLLVAPILQQLILNRAPEEAIAWADQIASWDLERVISCHMTAPVFTTPQGVRAAFDVLDCSAFPSEDLALLQRIESGLVARRWLRDRAKI